MSNRWFVNLLEKTGLIGGAKASFFKILLVLGALLFAVISLFVSDNLVTKMAQEERKKMEIWAYATQAIASSDQGRTLSNLTKILESNKTIPVIVTTEEGRIIAYNNIELPRRNPDKYLYKRLKEFRSGYQPIIIDTYPTEYLYYSDSSVLRQLLLFPYIQLAGFFIFLFVALMAIVWLKRGEQNRIWEGLSRETAHQLGTPISSLIAWNEYLKSIGVDEMVISEIGKDIDRLNIVAGRFQKIGGATSLTPENLGEVIENTVNYLRPRISNQVEIIVDDSSANDPIIIPINPTLISWVIENLIKNAVNAMKGRGKIIISFHESEKTAIIDVTDDGCGIPIGKQREIFRPGYTTRKRGWGLGLSLSKRIIEEYHKGKIFVKESTQNVGTTFRIILNTTLKE